LDTLIIENFRCFARRHEVPLRPLTLLVGENSTGKTSFLAANKLAHLTCQFVSAPNFNEQPFSLGAYDDIAYNHRKSEIADSFMLGFEARTEILVQKKLQFEARFADLQGLPYLTNWSAWIDDWCIDFSTNPKKDEWKVELKTATSTPISTTDSVAQLFRAVFFSEAGLEISNLSQDDSTHFRAIKMFIRRLNYPFAIAPIRAEPKRTYELTSVENHPQGSHVPVMISQIVDTEQWETIVQPLQEFARAAGLFGRISVKQLGKKNSGPFQIMIRVDNPSRNIVDVGYGVSQILPLAFDLIRGETGQKYMVQQPEVHLHPRAQAELGTLFGKLVKLHRKQFLIETHSDYLIDRVRIDVRDKNNLRADQVVILYFEKHRDGVKIFPIFLDELGNLIDAPPTYRQFFLQEESRFLGVS
jgi:AAA domain, putative AbiEii toxin, Type IV TA system